MPTIVDASEEFQVRTTREKCWAFLSDLSNIGSCIPGCESVSPIDSASATMSVKVKAGYLSKTFELKAKLKEVTPPSHISFTGEGQDAQITGNVDIGSIPSDPEIVSIRYKIEIKPISLTGKTAVGMIGKGLVKKQASEFASCVKSRLESGA